MSEKPLLVVPADHPPQVAGSPHLQWLVDRVDFRLFDDTPETGEEQVRRVGDAQLMINSRGHLKWPGELLRQLPNLRMITTCSIGTDSIDLAAARELGIVVSNVPGRTAKIVAEHALALLLAAARRVAFQTAELKAGRWTSRDNILLNGKTLGVVGTGSIGAAMIRLGKAIGMHVVAWTFHPTDERAAELGVEFVELDDLLTLADAVSLHVKLTEQSRYLIGSRELARMKSGSLLVNTARGPVVDNAALVEALHRGHLAGAGVDVFDAEPLPADDPILSCEQVVLTPHAADQMPEGMDLLNGGAVANVLAFLDGSPQNVVS